MKAGCRGGGVVSDEGWTWGWGSMLLCEELRLWRATRDFLISVHWTTAASKMATRTRTRAVRSEERVRGPTTDPEGMGAPHRPRGPLRLRLNHPTTTNAGEPL